MRVLLVSVGDQILRSPDRSVAARLCGYARRVDRLTQVVYSPRRHGCNPVRWSERFTTYPTRSHTRPGFLVDGYALGSRLLSCGRFDLIETQDPVAPGLVGLALGRQAGLPVVVTCHTEFFSRGWLSESPRNAAESVVARWVVGRADGVRVVSSALVASIRRLGVPEERIGVAPVPVDRGLFERGRAQTPARRGWDGPPDQPRALRCLFVGRLVPSKELPTLLVGLHRLRARGRELGLDVVGGGPERARLGALVADLGLGDAIRFHGQVAPEMLSEFYWSADVLALPTRYEGYGRVLVEAALHGLPVVASRVGGVTDILVDGETGWLVPPGDHGELADRLDRLLGDAAMRRRMGRAAWERAVDRFDPDRQADDVVAFWRKIAAMGPRRPR